jgi:hypothetical protein
MKAEAVLDNWADKTGGKARQKVRNRVLNGHAEIPLLHLKGPVTTYAAAPGSRFQVWEPTPGQAFERGCDGTNAWRTNPNAEAQLLTGKPRAAEILEAAFNIELCWREFYSKAETMAIRNVKRLPVADQPEMQRPCYEMKMTPKDPECEPELWYIDTENFQRVAFVGKVKVGDALIDHTMLFADFRLVNDVLEPFLVCEQIDVQKQFITYKSIQHNVRLSKYRFELPEAAKAQLTKAEKSGPASVTTTQPVEPADKPASSDTPATAEPPQKKPGEK